MPTLDPKFEIGGVHGDTEAAVRARAAYTAGFTGDVVSALVLRGNTPAQFNAALAEAGEIRSIARLCAGNLSSTGLDNEQAIEDAICKGIPLATVRKEIAGMLARMDEETQVNTAPKNIVAAQTADVYADRTAQIDAAKAKNA